MNISDLRPLGGGKGGIRKASQQQLHSSVGNDDGSATALLNTSGSDSEKAVNSSSSQSKRSARNLLIKDANF